LGKYAMKWISVEFLERSIFLTLFFTLISVSMAIHTEENLEVFSAIASISVIAIITYTAVFPLYIGQEKLWSVLECCFGGYLAYIFIAIQSCALDGKKMAGLKSFCTLLSIPCFKFIFKFMKVNLFI